MKDRVINYVPYRFLIMVYIKIFLALIDLDRHLLVPICGLSVKSALSVYRSINILFIVNEIITKQIHQIISFIPLL